MCTLLTKYINVYTVSDATSSSFSYYHHLHCPSPQLAPNRGHPPTQAPPLSRGMWACSILLDRGVWREEHKGGPSKWEAQLVCRENGSRHFSWPVFAHPSF